MVSGVQRKLNITKYLLTVLLLSTLMCTSLASEENELWLMVCTKEDPNITVDSLASLLTNIGYNAQSMGWYVTVWLPNGNIRYLTPNGEVPKLAEMWLVPPPSSFVHQKAAVKSPMYGMPIVPDAISRDTAYEMTSDAQFIEAIHRCASFPLAPQGLCYPGTQKAAEIYKGQGYNIRYMYIPDSGMVYQGHIWILVENPLEKGKWIAVDSYNGPTTNYDYYTAPYSFPDLGYLDLLSPVCLVSVGT
jgi:hypothetical protein